MTADTLLVIFAGVTALSIVLQGVFVVRTLRSTRDLAARIQLLSKELEDDAREVVVQLKEVTTGVDHLRRAFDQIGERAEEINQMFGQRAQDVDQLVGKLVEVGSKQAERIDAVVADTVEKFEETTSIIQEDILRPVVEISSIIKGLKTGVDYLLARKGGKHSEEDYPEEDLFI